MTVQEAIHKLVSWAEQQIGTREGPNNWNKYADSADMTKLYGWNVQNQPWCDVFVDAGFIACFGYDIGSAMTYQYAGCNGAACRYSADYYRKAGAFFQTPQLGDQVFFYSGGDINHTGVVTHVGDGVITTVEGNSSDMVARRSYTIGSPQIAGFGRPNWKLAENSEATPVTTPAEATPTDKPDGAVVADGAETAKPKRTCTIQLPVLYMGDGINDPSDSVRAAQRLLAGRGFRCGSPGADGEFGEQTRTATQKFQRSRNIAVDGVIGAETWTALLT